MNTSSIRYKRHRFPPQIIAHTVWLYFRFPLSLRLVEELLLERGIVVSYETIRRWGKKFGPDYARRTKRPVGVRGQARASSSCSGASQIVSM
jgi:putative transposase